MARATFGQLSQGRVLLFIQHVLKLFFSVLFLLTHPGQLPSQLEVNQHVAQTLQVIAARGLAAWVRVDRRITARPVDTEFLLISFIKRNKGTLYARRAPWICEPCRNRLKKCYFHGCLVLWGNSQAWCPGERCFSYGWIRFFTSKGFPISNGWCR